MKSIPNDTMEADRALDFINEALQKKSLKQLNNLESSIFEESCKGKQGLTYEQIGLQNGYETDSVKKTAYQLWKRLSNLCEVKIDKNNLKCQIERYYRQCTAVEVRQNSLDLPASSQQKLDEDRSNFVGREEDLAELDRLVQTRHKAIQIVATGGVGKSRFVQEYLTTRFDPKNVLEFNMARESQGVVSPLGRMEEWLKELGEEPGREFDISKERLRKNLREASSKIAIFIDNLEPTLENGLFIQPYRSEYVELLRVLTDSQVNAVTLITSREPLHESAISVETYRLKGLDLKAWQQYFQGRNVETNSTSLEEMRNAYGGNAKAMEILCGAIQKDADFNLDAYWQKVRQDLLQHKTLEHLVATQFDRLEETNQNAYNLLCRLGCYRYQDVPLVPEDGVLALLWDVPEKPLRVLIALKERCLVDVSQQQYRLHPVIREMAIDRLRKNNEDWEQANRKAANFWTESVETIATQEDATRALEAYYHYIEIEDFDRAAQVINYPRFHIDYTELLGISFYRLGLLSQIVLSIEFIIKKVSFGYNCSRLYNILGDSYWMSGNIHKSIKFTLRSQNIANHVIQNANIVSAQELSKIKNLYLTSFYNVGFCELALGNYERSLEIFKSLPETYQDPNCPPEYKIGYCFILSYLYSKVSPSKHKVEILEFAKESYVNLQSVDSWCIGYRYLFLGLAYKNIGNTEKSFEMFSDAIKFADRSNYKQVKAKALTGLGELHRIQGDFAKAIDHHQESIELLDEICAKCDLAEAYFQCALTYQEMGKTENSQENFDAALKLFQEIDAPKQIDRVQQARKTD